MSILADTAPFLTFRLADAHFALAVPDVVEVAAMVTPITVPDAPPAWAGMVNRRGVLFPLLEMRTLVDLPRQAWTANTLFIVVQAGEQQAGLVVDDVSPVKYLTQAGWHPLTGARAWVQAMMNEKDTILQWVDVGALLKMATGKGA